MSVITVYLIELIVAIVTIIIGFIICEVKKKDFFLRFLGISLLILIISIGITFIFEKPQMETIDKQIIEVNSSLKAKVPSTIYHFNDVTNRVKIVGDIDYSKIGEYKIYYELDTITGKYSKESLIIIKDTKKPEITLKGGTTHNQSYSKEYEDPGYEAFDDYDGNITDKVKTTKKEINNNEFEILYEVEDSSGNKTTITRNVKKVDDIPPVITLNGTENITLYLNNTYTEAGAKAVDEIDGDLTNKIQISGTVNTSQEGKYTIKYKVKDSNDNEATKERYITIKKEIERPIIPVQNGTNGNKGVIYLTFDDGPSSNITPKILDILNSKGVKATFFILNYNGYGETLVKREYNEGHSIGIHGYSHDYYSIYESEETYIKNVTDLQQKIKTSTGYTTTITRFPGGSSNTVSRYNPGIMSRLCKLVVQRGFKYYDWNVASGDAGGASTSDQVYNNVINGLSKSKQNVVLMHDFSSNSKILDALPRIIDYGLQNGYTFAKITESTPMVTHHVNN